MLIPPEFYALQAVTTILLGKVRDVRHREAGFSDITTIVIGAAVAGLLAIAVGAILTGKVTGKANSIPMD